MTWHLRRWRDVSHRSSPYHDVSSPNFIIRDHFLREYEASAKAIVLIRDQTTNWIKHEFVAPQLFDVAVLLKLVGCDNFRYILFPLIEFYLRLVWKLARFQRLLFRFVICIARAKELAYLLVLFPFNKWGVVKCTWICLTFSAPFGKSKIAIKH